MITTVRTTHEGRTYEVVADSDKIDAPMGSYVQVYRIRKDGSRGMRVQSSGQYGWAVWELVRDQVKTREELASRSNAVWPHIPAS
jgi:hypothetical protein